MAIELVVVHPFEGHQVGARIAGDAAIAAIRTGPHAQNVVAVPIPDSASADEPKKASEA